MSEDPAAFARRRAGFDRLLELDLLPLLIGAARTMYPDAPYHGLGRLIDRLDIAAVDVALREFDGNDWDGLARRLAGVSEWSASVTVITPAAVVGTVTATAEITAVAEHPTPDWQAELPGDLLTKLEAHLVVALAIWGYFAERNRRKDD
jgi:hypothetical protein